MGEKWKELGQVRDLIDIVTLDRYPERTYAVENSETGERREVVVLGSETVGEAIEAGRFKDRD